MGFMSIDENFNHYIKDEFNVIEIKNDNNLAVSTKMLIEDKPCMVIFPNKNNTNYKIKIKNNQLFIFKHKHKE